MSLRARRRPAWAAVALLLWLGFVAGQSAWAETPLTLYVFVGHDCPHCEAQTPFLDTLVAAHPDVRIERFEVSRTTAHHERFRIMAAAHGVPATSVPTVFVGGLAWVGDGVAIRAAVTAHVEDCLQRGCADSGVLGATAPGAPPAVLDLPLLGAIDLMRQPLVLSTLLIAFVDGFNPCSLWVLTILLALVIHSGSRRRILLVGSVYLLVTTAVYGLFITGVFGALGYVIYIDWIYWLVALLAIIFGVVNVKDYFWFQKGLSFTIDPRAKPGLFRRMRALLAEGRSLPALVGATAVMALGISLIELPCTAGFPVIWSGLVLAHAIDWAYFGLLLGLYLFVYVLIELVLIGFAVVTLRMDRFEATHGRLLKLIGGLIMLALALVLLVDPMLMQNAAGALGVFAAAAALGVVIVVVHRKLLPRLGVRIGDE